MRFAIWSGVATGIGMPSSMAKARHIIDVSRGWRTALRKLPNAPGGVVALDLISQLEINCHGEPGGLELPNRSASGLVDHSNVEEFGSMLRPSLMSGALIELLACQVAATTTIVHSAPRKTAADGTQSDWHPTGADGKTAMPTRYSDSILTEYWGAYERDLARPGYVEGRPTTVPMSDREGKLTLEYLAIRKQDEWQPKGNGLRFCLRLAAASGGIVRAGDFSQTELRSGDQNYATDVFGNWEGHVWDFYPDGRVKYLGLNLPRSQGRITFNGGGPLAHGGRPMGGISDESPLRAQRLNRIPLPV
jgi:hypothetical protein